MSELSLRAINKVKWESFLDQTAGLQGTRRGDGAGEPPDVARIKEVFETAKLEFAEAGKSMRTLMRIFVLLVGISIVIAIAGLLMVSVMDAVVSGSAVSSAGVIAMLALFARVHRYGRDQALFQFFVAADDLEVATSGAFPDGQCQPPVALLADHPVMHVA